MHQGPRIPQPAPQVPDHAGDRRRHWTTPTFETVGVAAVTQFGPGFANDGIIIAS